MKRAKHSGLHPVNCPACITRAEIARNPWENDYFEVFRRQSFADEISKVHKAALSRKEKNDAMRSLGLTKVRGALGGTYWE